ncbi:unnamed protein product [Oikopleura dioica]|uniref:ARID domain-containing protein n=1 Tax=Oikopleura dioica TaxID=34765 RepID=E4XN09_OIKDI|nr:unnamed protein product [Oikopleura dioica]
MLDFVGLIADSAADAIEIEKKLVQELYELEGGEDRRSFLDELFLFMTKRRTPIALMAKQVLDLYCLYKLVTERGGLVEVIQRKIWREITKGLNLPSSITSAAFTLRTQYMKYLYPYECHKENLSTFEDLQNAIDGNKRENRRNDERFEPFLNPFQSPIFPHALRLHQPLR